jgi:hypothetical protein
MFGANRACRKISGAGADRLSGANLYAPRTWTGFALSVSCFAWLPSLVLADGAFADSGAILLPRTHPHRIIASSDLSGLVVSDDDGATWSWICDASIGYFAVLFQLGPAPDENLYAITQAGLAISDDAGCTWQHAGGIAQRAGDVFPNPSDPQSVLAVAAVAVAPENHALSDVVAESHDGGRSFGSPMFVTSQASITGVEIARSNPSAFYLTMSSLQLQHPYIARSNDAGASWVELDLSGQLGRRPVVLRILAVDSVDANTLYIRVSDGTRDALAITRDGGETVQVALQLDSRMTAFLLRADGALVVASADATSFVSTDAGATFLPWSDAFHIQALAERDGALYATANSKVDGFAVAVSTDSGSRWRRLLQLGQLQGPSSCGEVGAKCHDAWTQLKPSLAVLAGKSREVAGASALDDVAGRAGDGRREPRVAGSCAIATPTGRSRTRSAGLMWLFAGAALFPSVKRPPQKSRLLDQENRI